MIFHLLKWHQEVTKIGLTLIKSAIMMVMMTKMTTMFKILLMAMNVLQLQKESKKKLL